MGFLRKASPIVFQNFRDLCGFMNFSMTISFAQPKNVILKHQHLWTVLVERGEIYLDKYAGWYAVRDESLLLWRRLSNGADGKRLLRQGRSRMDGRRAISSVYLHGVTNCWNFYAVHPDFCLPETRFNEVKVLCAAGLKIYPYPRTTFDWGVVVPGNEKTCHVCVDWCVDQLYYGGGLSWRALTWSDSVPLICTWLERIFCGFMPFTGLPF